MKKSVCYLLLFLSVALASACTDKDDSTSSFSINGGTTFLSLDALSRSGKITVSAPHAWSLEPIEEAWFTLSQHEGKAGKTQLHVSLSANKGAARSAELHFVCNGEKLLFTLSQSAAHTSFEEVDYCFYATFGTIPTLYAGLYVLANEKPSYVFYERSKTFDPALFPPHATVIKGSLPTATDAEMEQMAATMKQRIREINAAHPTAVFGLYVDDLRCRLGYDWFVAQGIDSARVKVSLLSDGTGTYHNFDQYFGDVTTAEQNWKQYAAEVEALDWNHGGLYPETRIPAELNAPTWPYYLSTRPDYRLILQNKSLLQSSIPFVSAQLTAMQTQTVQPYELLAALSPATRAEFYRMAAFDYDTFAALFDQSPKKNLIIVGTRSEGSAGEEQQRQYVARVVSEYADRYDIFFKPHPADTSSADYPTRFPGLTLLPGQMPFEIFVWALIDRIDLLGGNSSTTFLSVPLDKVGFLFAPNAQSLVHPLNLLFANAQGINWIQ